MTAAVLHAFSAWMADMSPAGVRLVDAILAVVAVLGVALLLAVGDDRTLLGAAVAGAVGVGLWLLTVMLLRPAGAGMDLWGFVTVLLDGLTVRLAAFTLRRRSRTPRPQPSQ